MDRRTLLAVSLCFLIFLGWQKYYIEPRLPVHPTVIDQSQVNPNPGTPAAVNNAASTGALTAPTGAPTRPATHLALSTGTGDASISDTGPLFVGWNLKSYKLGIQPQAAAVDLNSVTHEPGEVALAFDDPAYAYLSAVQGMLAKTPQGATWTYEDANVKLTRELSANDHQNYVGVNFSAQFKKTPPRYAFLSLNLSAPENDPDAQDRQVIYHTNDSVDRMRMKDLQKGLKEIATPVNYLGVSGRYFLMAVLPQGAGEAKALMQPTSPSSARANLVFPVAGNAISIPTKVYFGPKELEILRSVDPRLDHTVDFGVFAVIAYPILKFMKFLYGIFGNYGLAIIVLTVLLKVATYPLTYKSMKNMKQMAKVQPQIAKIREKYKDDAQTMNRELMTFMRQHGYNPLAGCLPMLIPIPIFFALYRVLYSAIELFHAPFVGWIQDLSVKDPFFITPVLMSILMFLQQKLTPNTATDPAQQKMLQFMPLIFGVMMLQLPAGLTLYMLVNALASIIQQLIINKKFDMGPKPGNNATVLTAGAR